MEFAGGIASPIPMRWFVLLLMTATPLTAETRKFTSGTRRTHLAELFTSEGCSSCPPAEQWFGTLREAPGLWSDFVPVAFHVTYWNHLGWRDRLAAKRFDRRQRAYATSWGSRRVYTPGFVLDGREWKGSKSAPGASKETAGRLEAEIDDAGKGLVRYDGKGEFRAWIALLGGGIESRVTKGENAGRTLHHEFVALVVTEKKMRDGKAGFELADPGFKGVKRKAIAVWISKNGEQTPLQATGGWLR